MARLSQRELQLKYFGAEFSRLKAYEIALWQKTYVERIGTLLNPGLKRSHVKILDIASGSGYVAIEMAKAGYSVSACDITPESVSFINRWKKTLNLKNLNVIRCPAEKIPFSSHKFDLIVANAILEHIPEEMKAIREWKRLIKPGGLILVTVPLKFRFIWPFLWPVNWWHDRRIGHLRRYDASELQKKFAMRIKEVKYTGHLIKFLGVLVSLFVKNPGIAGYAEKIDRINEDVRYGASNVIVVFKQ